MKISLNWLKDFVDVSLSNEQLDDLLTRAGVKVEHLTATGVNIPNVVVGQILSSEPHPNADRLSVCKVDDGSGTPRQIVCGAKNYKVTDKVPVALPGAVLPGDFKIKVGKLRGVESEGMLCSAKELELPGDASGLLILSSDSRVGAPLSELFPASTVIELEITPNRSDWLSHVGVAREVAVSTKAPLKWAPLDPPAVELNPAVAVINPGAECELYSITRISGVQVGASSALVRERLEACGLRSINSVVDVTNYVMYELGQPLHVFDAAKVNGPITVRLAREGESFLALDGKTYSLTPEDTVIADSTRVLALAGIMGGEDSGVTENTTEIWLESARFTPSAIRRAGRRLDLHSDSSYRFERGVDGSGVLRAVARAAELIGGQIVGTTVIAGAIPSGNVPVSIRPERCRALLGAEISDQEITDILTALGLDNVSPNEWRAPGWRLDLHREVDFIEEVIRVAGIERVRPNHSAAAAPRSAADRAYDFQSELRRKLAGRGFCEGRTSTLVSATAAGEFGLRLRNPMGEEQACLRSTLVPGLLTSVERNVRAGVEDIRLFEIGHVFSTQPGEQFSHVALTLCGPNAVADWRGYPTHSLDWFDLKGFIVSILGDHLTWRAAALPDYAVAAEAFWDNEKIGFVGLLSPAKSRELDARHPVLLAEITLDPFLKNSENLRRYREIPKYPAIVRDIAPVLEDSVSFSEVSEVLETFRDDLLADFQAFNLFRDPTGEKLPVGRKSLAISLTFRSPERTLNGNEIDAVCTEIRQKLVQQIGAEFRE